MNLLAHCVDEASEGPVAPPAALRDEGAQRELRLELKRRLEGTVLPCIDYSVRELRKGEVSIISAAGAWAYGAPGFSDEQRAAAGRRHPCRRERRDEIVERLKHSYGRLEKVEELLESETFCACLALKLCDPKLVLLEARPYRRAHRATAAARQQPRHWCCRKRSRSALTLEHRAHPCQP